MRILHIIRSVDRANGGPIEGICQLAAAMSEFGHTIEIASLDDPSSSAIKDVPVHVTALGPGRGNYGYSSKLAPWLVKNYQNYDRIVVNGIWQYHSYAAWRVLKPRNVPYFVFTHGMLDPWFKRAYPLKHFKKQLYWPFGEYKVLRDAKAVLFTCEDEKILARQSFKKYACNEAVVNYGTSLPQVDCDFVRSHFLSSFPELKEKRILLYLSRIHPKKGCDILIKAFATAFQRDNSLRLVLAGPDKTGMLPELQALAKKSGVADFILWPGMLKADMKWGAYYASEVFVLPSHQENFGIVVAEALACSRPVLISNKVNIWREIEQDGAGFVENDDLYGTEALLSKWLELSDDTKAKMSAQAKETFLQRFEIHGTVKSLLAVYNAASN